MLRILISVKLEVGHWVQEMAAMCSDVKCNKVTKMRLQDICAGKRNQSIRQAPQDNNGETHITRTRANDQLHHFLPAFLGISRYGCTHVGCM